MKTRCKRCLGKYKNHVSLKDNATQNVGCVYLCARRANACLSRNTILLSSKAKKNWPDIYLTENISM